MLRTRSVDRPATLGRTVLEHVSRHVRQERNDDGSLVLTLVLIVALSMLIAVSVSSVIGAFPTAAQSQTGTDAVAQAHAGLSDALFRLDQMGDNATSFCVGTPPAGVLPSDLTSAQCSPSGTEPLGNAAPGLRYYFVEEVAGTLPAGVTNELTLNSYAVSGNQSRTITATLYEESNRYGFFGVDGYTDDGALKNAAVATVGGSTAATGSVLFGGGQSSDLTCHGVTGGVITVTGEAGFVNNCSGTSSASNLEPAAPTMCAANQLSTAFAPCIDASSSSDFATVNGGRPFCPLPGSGVNSTLQTVTGVTSSNDSPEGLNSVFDCSSNGAAVTISTTSKVFGLTSIPSGNYYLDSNNVTIGDLDSSFLKSSGIQLFILPQSCGSTSCAVSVPTAPTSCSSMPTTPGTTLTLSGNVNVNTASPAPPPGDPGNLSVYWESLPGSLLTGGKSNWYDGALYAPNAQLTQAGSKAISWYGSLVLGCWTINGAPNLTFAYPFHDSTPVLSWSVASYHITD
jgi:hypothetical protein